MKCPECGLVSLSLLPQCENCGHRFTLLADAKKPSTPEWASESLERWPDELTERVQRFRRRRAANLRDNFDPEGTLELDFQGSGAEDPALAGQRLDVPLREKEWDAALGDEEKGRAAAPAIDSVALRSEAVELRAFDSEQAVEPSRETRQERGRDAGDTPMVTESWSPDGVEFAADDVSAAPLGQRFLAGVLDGVLLLFALGLFVVTFWWIVGGRLPSRPADLAVLGFVVGFLVLSYFASFSRLAPATPGQQALGLTLRTLQGGALTWGQALWRAFGYLVSCAALMLGFVWALVDVDGLTWHDRMSGTFLAQRKSK